jgi:tRNA(fMet)-specific endonuclease VapC
VSHLLDTNTCIDHLRQPNTSLVTGRLSAAPVGSVSLCSIVLAELLFGARRSTQVQKNVSEVHTFCAQFAMLPFEARAADEYSKTRSHLARLGTPIGPNDLMIAAIALADSLILVTHNTTEFGRVPGLHLEDWQIP